MTTPSGPSMDVSVVPPSKGGAIEDLLGTISEASGTLVTAPQFRGRRIKEARGGPARDVLHRIASELGAVPVYHGRSGSIELVPRARLSVQSGIAATADERRVVVDFRGLGLAASLQAIARAAGIDLVIPPALDGPVDATLGEMGWRQALESVLDAAGVRARTEVSPSGVVLVLPMQE